MDGHRANVDRVEVTMQRHAPHALRSTLGQKAGATAVNAAIAALVAAPVLWIDTAAYRESVVVAFFLTVWVCRRHCPGCWVVASVANRPATLWYCALYTLGFAACLYWVVAPGDLLLVNGLIQWGFLQYTGNTAHGWLAGVYTITR